MRDDWELLREDARLRELLAHYARAGADDKQRWVERCMGPPDLNRLHGRLLAHDWLEQSTGATPGARADGASCCYRLTSAGRRALRQAGPTAEEAAAADGALETVDAPA